MFQKSTVKVRNNRFQLFVPVGSMFTVTTAACRVLFHVVWKVKTGQKGAVSRIPSSSPSFPLRYADDFQSTPQSQNARRRVYVPARRRMAGGSRIRSVPLRCTAPVMASRV